MDEKTLEKITKVGEIYTASYPIEFKQLFSGRQEQLNNALSLIPQKGLHAIIYGDRGVGKTSFANIVKLFFETSERQVAKVSCTSGDSFSSLWKNIFSKFYMTYEEAKQKVGFTAEQEIIENKVVFANLLQEGEDISPSKILELLQLLKAPIIIIDEFDRLDNSQFNKKLLTDLIKSISDSLPTTTLVIVGVSEDVSSLIQEHESIERNLAQIHMPTMISNEIQEIILKGQEPLSISFNNIVVQKIIELSSGFPHFAHSLCYHSAFLAIIKDENEISETHLRVAITQTINNAHESLRNSYRIATLATKQNIFSEVLFAASIAPTDEYGYFQANDLEPILTKILGKETKVNNFTFHLGKFCISERGEILKATGSKNRQRYKFKNPLMKAYIRLKSENDQSHQKL